jgi:subtilisin family serine protease
MIARRPAVFVAVLLLIAAAVPYARPIAARNMNAIPGQYIVVFKDTVGDAPGRARALASANGLGVLHTYQHALKGFSATVPAARLAMLRSSPDIAFVVPDQTVTLLEQTVPTGIQRIGGLLSTTAKINGLDERVDVDVAVIDTGIDTAHADLVVAGGKNCSTGKNYKDGHGHGTHVAGTIGALDNGAGVVGVAPGARLWAVRVLDNTGSGTMSSVVCGIDWVAANAATIDVANMSLGGTGADDGNCGVTNNDAEHKAICNAVAKGVTFVVAAGNSSADSTNYIPAAYDEVITVSALADFNGTAGGGAAATCRADEDDTFANFSNYGADVDLIAPGVCILSTWKGNTYSTISGTSMASPHVAGAAALYKATHATATPAQVRSALIGSGTLDWNNADDRDLVKEPLLNVAGS